jgi:hypothetical protein
MKVKQLSVFLENKPGSLSTPVQLLARAKLNILALSVADTREFGILRVMVQDWEKAKQVLEKNGFAVKVTEVLALEVDDQPGGLARILEVLEKAKVNLEYTYAFTVKHRGKGLLVFRFSDADVAIQALKEAKVNVLGSSELFSLLGN